MDENQIKHVLEAALLAAGRPLPLDTLASLFSSRAELDKDALKRALDALAEDYRDRGLELKEVASGYRIQIKSSMSDWLMPLWEERAPRYTRALMETLALIAYRQPITRAEIEEVRGVSVSSSIVRTLMERNWIRVVGHRDVPGKPAMFGTTKDFLDYFGLKKLEDLPALAELNEGVPELTPQTDLIEAIDVGEETDGEAATADGSSHEAESDQSSQQAPSDEQASADEAAEADTAVGSNETVAPDDAVASDHSAGTEGETPSVADDERIDAGSGAGERGEQSDADEELTEAEAR